MSCYPEATYAVYVDGELPPDEVRALEAHLVGCRDCRERVLALRDEAGWLADVLHERGPRVAASARVEAPARGLALGLVPTLALTAVGITVAGWLLETGVPAAIGWLSPVRITGVYEMAFDLIFLLRDQVPGLVELLASAAAMLSLSALLTVALSALTRRLTGPGGSGLLLALLAAVAAAGAAPTARAVELRLGEERVEVPAGETVDESLVVSGDRVQIDGDVDGDLAVLAERVLVRGNVAGNVFASGRLVTIEGRVDGSLFAFAERVEVLGEVRGSVYTGAEEYRLASGASIGRDAVNAGHGTTVEGRVGRDLAVLGEWAELRGEVGRNLDARVERLALLDGARVDGDADVLFLGPEENLEQAPGASIGGSLETSLFEHPRHEGWSRYARAGFYLGLAVHLAAAFALGLLLRWLVPALYDVRLDTVGAFFGALGWGFVLAIAAPLVLVIAALTLVGIPLAVLGLFAFLSALYLAGIVVAALVGRTLVRGGEAAEGLRGFSLALLAGLVVLVIGMHLPLVGGPLRVVVVLTGLGLLFRKARDVWEQRARGASPI